MNTQKKFDTVSIVILTLMVGSEAILKVVADLMLGIPVTGEVVFPLVDIYTFIIWAVIVTWFVIKLGFAQAKGVYLLLGGIASFFGIPIGLPLAVGVTVIATNYPKVAKVAEVVTAPEELEAGGAEAIGGEAGTVAGGASGVEGSVASGTASGEAALEGAAKDGTPEAGGEAAPRNKEGAGADVNPEALGEAPEAMEELQRNLTGANPVVNGSDQFKDKDEEEEEKVPDGNAPVTNDLRKEEVAREEKAKNAKKLLSWRPPNQNPSSDQEAQDDGLKKAA